MEEGGVFKDGDMGDVSKFLNRLLGLKLLNQNMVSTILYFCLYNVNGCVLYPDVCLFLRVLISDHIHCQKRGEVSVVFLYHWGCL